jgi:hypothetical protein
LDVSNEGTNGIRCGDIDYVGTKSILLDSAHGCLGGRQAVASYVTGSNLCAGSGKFYTDRSSDTHATTSHNCGPA